MQCKCSTTSYLLAARCATFVALVPALPAHAQQFVLVDQTYTADKDNTQDSHFTAELKSGAPTDLRAPTNYANGSVHVALEIQAAPGTTKALYNICLENSTDVACLPYVAYAGQGNYKADPKFSSFWQYDKVDWTKGVTKVSLIIKDEKEQKVQGNAAFYPYKAHVTLTVVAADATFDPGGGNSGAAGGSGMQSQAGRGAGTKTNQAGSGGAAGKASTSSNQGGNGGMSGKAGSGGASTGSGGKNATASAGMAAMTGAAAAAAIGGSGGAASKLGQAASAAGTAGHSSTPTERSSVSGGAAGSDDASRSVSSQLEDTSGCTVSRASSRTTTRAWPLLALGLGLLMRRARSRTRGARSATQRVA